MKKCIDSPFLLSALIASLGLILVGQATAGTFTTLHTFMDSAGADPFGGLILSGNTLYGTTEEGGSSGEGMVFALNTNGTGFTNLHGFTATKGQSSTNSDGAYPFGRLVLSGNTLYGTTPGGGSSGNGTVFKVNTDGTGFTNLHSFTASDANGNNSDGMLPFDADGLILSGSTLYGTTFGGGAHNSGTVFALNTNGTGFTNLHSFTNSDGANPYDGLVLSGNTLYGTTSGGGSSYVGTVFALNTDGTGFTNLHSFTNSDGANPLVGLIVSGSTLYGTTGGGGSSRSGTVFALNTNGTGFTVLYSFPAIYTNSSGDHTNSGGAGLSARLTLSGSTLYGPAFLGGTNGSGTVFALNTNGTGFTVLYSFPAAYTNSSGDSTNSGGAFPRGGLILSGSTLYGEAGGGNSGEGTVYSLSMASVIPPQLTLIPSGASVILTWPTNSAGFTLKFTTNLVSPAVWTTASPAPTVVNTNNVVTNTVSATQQFFRLSQ